MAIAVGVLTVVVCGAVVVLATGELASWGNRASLLLFAALVVLLLWRLGGVRADVDPNGITVRNVVVTRRLEWSQVVAVRFGPDQAWLQLDLSDGETLSVVAVQQADGQHGRDEASRVATLAQAHGEGREPTRGTTSDNS
ncbi:hypothetical protein GCM10025865_29480 [Paraoerskovia sediminicola]|uniref:Low molecular weight protein antigen 6 PH domain-containing protein n=1 Tax=Paraoerskovia sediminicola TaxID=1138587 RepID=A0ABM8G6B2_9CELL|nr:PH domain-containing protein [Paraoerskovia sediminicola]BDZ43649.1 hypothetical protein GCM10025865_29480 [Paraoerskovia sediminicola]